MNKLAEKMREKKQASEQQLKTCVTTRNTQQTAETAGPYWDKCPKINYQSNNSIEKPIAEEEEKREKSRSQEHSQIGFNTRRVSEMN